MLNVGGMKNFRTVAMLLLHIPYNCCNTRILQTLATFVSHPSIVNSLDFRQFIY
jgi:hypothetical protein